MELRHLTIILRSAIDRGDGPGAAYRIANFVALADSDVGLFERATIPIPGNGPAFPPRDYVRLLRDKCFEERKSATGWLIDRNRRVILDKYNEIHRLRIEGVGSFLICSRDACLILEDSAGSMPTPYLGQVLAGPPIIYLLSCLGTFSLHGSAVRIDGKLVIFLGDSGAGKSTIASVLDSYDAVKAARVCDDIVPVRGGENGLIAYPAYPQLKLSPIKQRTGRELSPERVSRLYVLNRQPGSRPDGRMELTSCGHTEATLTAARHTVAARLFDRELQDRHLHFSASAAREVSVKEIRYPTGTEHLAELCGRIAEDVAHG